MSPFAFSLQCPRAPQDLRAKSNHPLLASQALAIYRQLYDIEDRGRALSIDDRQALRDTEATPIWDRLRELIDCEAARRLFPKFDEGAEAAKSRWKLFFVEARGFAEDFVERSRGFPHAARPRPTGACPN